MAWWQLSVECSSEQLEHTESILLELGAHSLSITDARDEPIFEPLPGTNPTWSQSIVTGLFDQSQTLEQLYDQLVKTLPAELSASIRKHELEDQVWERAFLDQYHPARFGQSLWICPSWLEPPEADAINIILDPGMAFGTGSHPTTALCLEYLDQHPPVNQSVLDFGCGSGILAIAANKLGASEIHCVDIDPQALQATRENAIRNNIEPEHLHPVLPKDLHIEPVDYLMANILSGPLIELQPLFTRLTRPGSRILLSGILEQQLDNVQQAYQSHFTLDTVKIQDQWCRISGTRK